MLGSISQNRNKHPNSEAPYNLNNTALINQNTVQQSQTHLRKKKERLFLLQ